MFGTWRARRHLDVLHPAAAAAAPLPEPDLALYAATPGHEGRAPVVLVRLDYGTGTAFTRSQTKSLWSKLRTTLLPLVPEFPWSSTTIQTSS